MIRRRHVLAAFALPGAMLLVAGPAVAATSSVRITEANERYHFTPATITVSVGDTVRWANTTDAAHTVTSDSGAFDSGTVEEGATYSRTFSKAGTYAYHCEVHPYMTGAVVVRAATASSPAGAPPETDTAQHAAPTPGGSASVLGLLLVAGVVSVGLSWMRLARR